MTESLSQTFARSLGMPRDALYTRALARESSPAKAEAALQKAARTVFGEYATDPHLDVGEKILKEMGGGAIPEAVPGAVLETANVTAMPADVWARLSATIQLEAARLTKAKGGGAALNPDSVLLSPDPLLAPKKSSWMDDSEAFDLSPPSRFLLASAIALMIGVALTIYILTRPPPPSPSPPPSSTVHVAGEPANTVPATASRPVAP